MQEARAAYLLEQYVSGAISADELSELKLLSETEQETVQQGIRQWLEQKQPDEQYDAGRWQQVLNAVMDADKDGSAVSVMRLPFYRRPVFRYVAAAMIVVATIAGFWIVNQKETPKQDIVKNTPVQKDVPPGKDGAILTLADGTQIVLDSVENGILKTADGTEVMVKDGQISYAGANGEDIATYNTMTTPRGRQFNVTLPDGSRVWLNASSSLRYPTVFKGKERKVEVRGEAYFEIVANPSMPFTVNVNNRMDVEVLGTSFNINAYDDEPAVNATLIDGAVKVHAAGAGGLATPQVVALKPGQQAKLNLEGSYVSQFSVNKVDIDQVTAWKKGAFVFNDADLPSLMRQLARWYDVEVEYAGIDIPNATFSGKIGRDLSLAVVMAELTEQKLKFKIDGKKIIVMP